ncbi:MAG: HlyD family efflux transporter periplasmic adaptor subunit [Flavobacteriaceae bacterium]|nr:HlyD family efflux transporter periplasmic adaptor subunit [Flavobacteriaceae bacterium]
MRKFILIVLGILLLAGSFMLAKNIIASRKKPKPKFDKIVKSVVVKKAQPKRVPVVVTASGNLVAKRKLQLFSEVQGVLVPRTKDFKSGAKYTRGEVIVAINSQEFAANLNAQKSNFFNLLTATMADLRLDYPKAFPNWQAYLQQFDMAKVLQPMPKPLSDKEKYFVSGRGLYTSYYNIKNLEVKLGKHQIRAPYKGVLTEATITPGSLVRPGQKIGEFIDPSIYELVVNVNASYAKLLQIGNKVALEHPDSGATYTGVVQRVNARVETSSQTVQAAIDVQHPDLKEGLYLEAQLQAKEIEDAISVSRKLLVDNSKLFVVQDSVLQLLEVKPVYFSTEEAVIQNIPVGTQLLDRIIPGAFEGMPVKIITQ